MTEESKGVKIEEIRKERGKTVKVYRWNLIRISVGAMEEEDINIY